MNLPKWYYPTLCMGCNPIHEVRDWCKVRKLVRDALNGAKIRPILIDGTLRNGSLLTGTHRAAANDILMLIGSDIRIPYILLSDLDTSDFPGLSNAVENGDYEAINDIWDRQNFRKRR